MGRPVVIPARGATIRRTLPLRIGHGSAPRARYGRLAHTRTRVGSCATNRGAMNRLGPSCERVAPAGIAA